MLKAIPSATGISLVALQMQTTNYKFELKQLKILQPIMVN